MCFHAGLIVGAHLILFNKLANFSSVEISHSFLIFDIVVVGALLMVMLSCMFAWVGFEISEVQMFQWLARVVLGDWLVGQ